MTRDWLDRRWHIFKWLLAPGIMGIVLVTVGACEVVEYSGGLLIVGILLTLPCIVYLNLFVIWHWKGRYRGNHPELWGAVILLDASGWFKLVYFFRHIIPDVRQSGRYAQLSAAGNTA